MPLQKSLRVIYIACLCLSTLFTQRLGYTADITRYSQTYLAITQDNPHTDIWSRLRQGFCIPDLDDTIVAPQISLYLSKEGYFERTLSRASLYLFHVIEALQERNMPMELALLPFIESAFNPHALSPAKAAGMWQFIPSTGRIFTLKQNLFKDERRDIVASTDAALSYLQQLYSMFGDWQLALAAYNWGEGAVQRAIDRNGAAGLPTDFVSLMPQMPKETHQYVPRLQAVKMIISAPERYHLSLPSINNQPYFVSVHKTRDIDVKLAARLAEMSLKDFQALNPQFNRPVIVGSKDTKLLLPESNAEKFKANLSQWKDNLSSWTTHTIHRPHERIENIAAKFGTTPDVIRRINHIPQKTVLKAGSTILIPKTDITKPDITAKVANNAVIITAPDIPRIKNITIKVAFGESLSSIARRYKVTLVQIKSWNRLKHNKIRHGQTLQLQVASTILERLAAKKVPKSQKNKKRTTQLVLSQNTDKTSQ